jgi:hypothetical protein
MRKGARLICGLFPWHFMKCALIKNKKLSRNLILKIYSSELLF